MRILQVTSDWKWTGPASPMLALLLAQRRRGHCAELVCPDAPVRNGPSLLRQARSAGVEPILEIAPGRGAVGWRDFGDARRLGAVLHRHRFDVVHTWHTRDHVLALRAAGSRRRAGPLRVVRSYARAERIPDRSWNRWLFGRGTDGLLCVSPKTAIANAALRRGRPIEGVLGAVDLDRFRPRSADPGVRAMLGLRPDQRVVGIAARIQRRRRFDLLLAAMARLARRDPQTALLVIGRGTHMQEVAVEAAARLGIRERVIFAGHRTEDYPDVLRAIDVFTLLVPGSDGGCRAVLEAAACGIPAVTTGRGALPEIVAAGETGLVVDEDPEALCEGWERLLSNASLRSAMGAAARRRAERCFSSERFADAVTAFYRSL